MEKIKLGYEIPTGKPVYIHPSHLIVTGVTQKSGKTTTLEALVNRSGAKAIVFKTKPGEKSFSEGKIIQPFFREKSDYEFVRSLIEVYSKDKISMERGSLITVCKNANSLSEIKGRIDDQLSPPDGKKSKLNGFQNEIFIRLQHYLDIVLPEIQNANFSKQLDIHSGLNIMDLEYLNEEVQALVIGSVVSEVLKTMKNTIIVIPEAWKFIPQTRNNPCKLAVQAFIRQGATNGNYIWIDSQDMSNTDKGPLKSISTWILGYQSEINEVEHTLDQLSLTKKLKPKQDDIMGLRIGEFYLSTGDGVIKVYVQPSWLKDESAKQVAMGVKKAADVISEKPMLQINLSGISQLGNTNLSNKKEENKPESILPKGYITIEEFNEFRIGVLAKFDNIIIQVNNFIKTLPEHLKGIIGNSNTNIDQNQIESILLQILEKRKIPGLQNSIGNTVSNNINTEDIVSQVLAQMPKSPGQISYQVAPLEKIKQGFLITAKDRITGILRKYDDKQKIMLTWIEQNGKQSSKREILLNCFGMSATTGPTYSTLSKKIDEMVGDNMAKADSKKRISPNLIESLKSTLTQYGAKDDEIMNVYNHILAEIIKV